MKEKNHSAVLFVISVLPMLGMVILVVEFSMTSILFLRKEQISLSKLKTLDCKSLISQVVCVSSIIETFFCSVLSGNALHKGRKMGISFRELALHPREVLQSEFHIDLTHPDLTIGI